MTMDLGSIDYWANHGTSGLHRTAPAVKLAAATLTLLAVIVASDPLVLVGIYLVLVGAVLVARLPVRQVLAIAAYPVIFAALFAISRWDGTVATPATILLKTMTAALTMVLLITTTPYPHVFVSFRRLLPGVVVDALFLTYRSFFLLLALATRLATALRLRGGISRRRYLHNLRVTGQGLGLLILRALSMSEQSYNVMRLRGYAGVVALPSPSRPARAAGAWPLALSLLLCLGAAAAALGPAPMALWLELGFPALGVALLVAGVILRARTVRPA